MTTRLHNPGPYEVVYDSVGHALGGGESVEVSEIDPVTTALLQRGDLIVVAPVTGIIRKKREPKVPPTPADPVGTEKEDTK